MTLFGLIVEEGKEESLDGSGSSVLCTVDHQVDLRREGLSVSES